MIKQKIRTIIKRLILKFLEIVYNIVNIFKKKKIFSLELVDKIVLLHTKPLGLGDLVLLSPFYLLIIKNAQNPIFIVSDYPQFLEFGNAKWLRPSEANDEFFINSLVISPTLTLSHLKYVFKSEFYIGYFISNRLISNFYDVYYKYDAVKEHYLNKTFPILNKLRIPYDRNKFEYPKVSNMDFSIKVRKYIIVAPYSNWEERQYSSNNYIKLLKNILQMSNYNILIVGSPNSEEIKFNSSLMQNINNSRIQNLTGKTSLQELTKLIADCSLYIGNDAGPSNIAYISAPKSLVFFGSVYYENRLPKNQLLKEKIIAFDNRNSCNIFPCYDGFNKPYCKNTEKYSCLNVDISNKIESILNVV